MMFRILLVAVVALVFGLSHAMARPAPQRPHETQTKIDYVPKVWSANDIDEALKLAEGKDFPDQDGARCWRLWRPAAVVMEAHPLPKQPIKAADLQVARLVKITVNKLQSEGACKWLSDRIQDAWGPFETTVSPRRHSTTERILSGVKALNDD